MQQVGVDLSVYVAHLSENSDVFEATSFLSSVILKSASLCLFKYQHQIMLSYSQGREINISKLVEVFL